MIITRLKGGLGNQLFQFAIAHGLAEQTGDELLLDKSQFRAGVVQRRGYPPHHQDYLRRLGLSCPFFTGPFDFFCRYSVRLFRGYDRLKWNVGRPPETLEALLHKAWKGNLFLTGYWQSPEYVAAYSEGLRSLLRSRMTIYDDYKYYKEFIRTREVTSVHLRLGDYIAVTANAKKYHHIDKAQFAHAIQDLRKRRGTVSMLVFSDDPHKARDYFDAGEDINFVESAKPDPVSELALMSECRNHIISNSTFSWWAAFLGDQEDGLVYCPRRWRKDSEFRLCIPDWQLY